MWKLQPTESGVLFVSEEESIVLFAGQEYVVGRKNCEILLSNDQSISRVHANLTVTQQAVSLKDSSKYGTFINGEKLETGSTKILQTGDKITFGVFQSKFSLEKECVVVCSSCVDNEGKASLSQDLCSVGGRLVNSWTLDCTHLVMPTAKVTIKTICALLCCRPIVKPEFFSAFSKAVQQNLPLPKPEKFRPQTDEPSLAKEDVDLSARPERKSLFKGKTFLFLNSKQARMKRLSQAVSCGGGVSQLLDQGSLPISLLESSSTCVVDITSGNSQAVIPPASKKWVDSVAQILHRNGLRFITESEIGLAAIHINNQTYCNPFFSMQSESVKVKPVIAAATPSQNTAVDETALAPPSQNITTYVVNTELSQDQSRPREDNSVQSVAKFFRKDGEDKEDEIQQSSYASRSHKTSHTAQNQHSSVSQSEFSASLVQACGSSQNSGSMKRKQPEQDAPSAPKEPAAAADLEMSLEELESIMSDEMDEPLQAAANKKQRLDSGTNSRINNPQLPNWQEGIESKSRKSTKNQQSSANNFQNLKLDRTGPAATNQGSDRQSKRSSKQTPDLDAHSSAKKGKRPELEEVKEEEVSFVVNSRTQNGISQHCEPVVKKEMQALTSKSGSENDPELPRRLLQIHFKSLTVSTSSRSRPSPLQTHDPNDKNVKRFRKEEKQNEREKILGDDLFRYNPRRAKK
ncbi:hypothetical protein cypCar_00032040 [Cyprinus carpio]|nr:hypothetical protein cypCar_00032040 [Cyprinus carpio]